MKRDSTAHSMFVPVIVAATPEDEVAHKLGVKVWFQENCTVKKTGLSAMMKAAKPKVIYILPGKISLISGEIDKSLRIQAALTSEKTIEIDGNLRESAAKKEVTLEFHEPGQAKPTKEVIVFDTDQAAAHFMTTLREERERSYIHSENFTPKFREDLNSAIRMKIQAGDEPLRQMFLACCNQASPSTAVEALFTNYRTMMDFEESAVSFADLLSAAAQDPIVYILFLCCAIDAGKSMNEHFQAITDREIDNSAELFQLLLSHITHTVSKPEWRLKRELLLSQFQYPASAAATGVAGITTYAAFTWTARFTDNYHQFSMDIHTLNRLLVDEKYLCFICLDHHAKKGYTDIVQAVFPSVPQEYLFSTFDTDVRPISARGEDGDGGDSAEADNPWHKPAAKSAKTGAPVRTIRPHFVDFLFHRNLSEKSLFLNLLMAFKQGDGYDDKFFTMFLTEAISNDRPRVAVDVITNILFTEDGEPSVHALKFCPKIPIILFEALVSGILNTNGTGHQVSDDMRLLFEIAMRFQYFALRKELLYLKNIDRLFRDKPEKIAQFTALLEEMKFLPYVIDVCNHNLAHREAPAAPAHSHSASTVRMMHSASSAYSVHHSDSGSNLPARAATFEDTGGDIPTIEPLSVQDPEEGGADEASVSSLPTPPAAHAVPHYATAAPPSFGQSRTSKYGSGDMNDNASVSSANNRRASVNPYGAGNGNAAGGNANPESKYSQWMVRTDGNLIALIYGFLTLVITCGALPKLKDTVVVENETVKRFLAAMVPAFYSTLMQPNTALRARITDFLRDKFNIVSLYQDLLGQPMMLCKAEHFRYSFLHALSYDAHFLTDCMVALVTVAVKLEQYDDLYVRLNEVDFGLGRSQEKQQQLEVILHHVVDRDSAELVENRLQLQDLATFANQAMEALTSYRGKADSERVVIEKVRRLLVEEPVADWVDGFRTLAA